MVNRPIIAHRDNTHCSPLAVAAIGDCSIWREHDLPAERSAQLAELFDPSSASQLPPCNYRCLHEYYWYWRQYYRTTTHRSTLPAQSALFFYWWMNRARSLSRKQSFGWLWFCQNRHSLSAGKWQTFFGLSPPSWPTFKFVLRPTTMLKQIQLQIKLYYFA